MRRRFSDCSGTNLVLPGHSSWCSSVQLVAGAIAVSCSNNASSGPSVTKVKVDTLSSSFFSATPVSQRQVCSEKFGREQNAKSRALPSGTSALADASPHRSRLSQSVRLSNVSIWTFQTQEDNSSRYWCASWTRALFESWTEIESGLGPPTKARFRIDV